MKLFSTNTKSEKKDDDDDDVLFPTYSIELPIP